VRQSAAFNKAPRVEIEHEVRLGSERRVADSQPRSLLLRLDRILSKPAPDRRRRRVRDAALDAEAV
jgi:hypothetical protein